MSAGTSDRADAMPCSDGVIAGLDFLAGGGEMGARMRALDWTTTPLGSPARWPQSLRTIVRVMLDSRYAMWMLWGPQLTFFCNDAYLPTVGIKREWVLGARADRVWEEIWPDIGPRIHRVLTNGEATWDEALLLYLERSGFPEETYHTFSYSPVRDDDSRIAGMLCVVTEVTDRVIGERRLQALRDLAAHAAGIEGVQQTCDRLMQVLGGDPLDVPFSCLYLIDPTRHLLRLARCTGEVPLHFRPQAQALTENAPWPLGEVASSGSAQLVRLDPLPAIVPAPLWPGQRVEQALVLPIPGQGALEPVAVLVVGVSPRRVLDDRYRGFFELVTRQFAAAIADAQAHEQQRLQAQALAELDRAKTAFFSNVSHEFRTPLTLMLGPLEDALSAPPESLPAHRADLELVHRNGLRLLRLVNTLLEFTRIEAGRTEAQYEPTDLAAFSSELASVFRAATEQAGIDLEIDCPPLPEMVWVDRSMWEKIVLNLVSNAFKFTMRGRIAVGLKVLGQQAVLTVADTGTGIAADQLPKLFERFYRVQGAQGRTHEGTGIGLSLVQELVRLHGGTIEVHSVPNEGSTFTVRIPLGTAHLPPDRLSSSRASAAGGVRDRTVVEETLHWLSPEIDAGTAGERPAHASAHPAQQPGRQEVVLVADDNADMRRYIARLLGARYTVRTAANGLEALAAARASRPDLLLSDVMMPGLDGLGLLQAIRADPALSDLPAILLSARAGEEASIEGLSVGANDYLIKPFSARELLARVGVNLQLAAMRRDLAERDREELAAMTRLQEALRDADRRKDEFLATLAHELRNPLAPIRYASALLRNDADAVTLEKARVTIDRQARHLARLLDDLLDLSRITRNAIVLKNETLDLRRSVQEAFELARPAVEAQRHRAHLTLPIEPVWIVADAERMLQIIGNLLSNAIKYTEPGGEIAIDVESGTEEALLRVRDTGVGFPPEMAPRLFELFSQVKQTLKLSRGGLGIGLAVVEQLVKLHGGSIEACSPGLGAGSSFTLRLPRGEAHPATLPQAAPDTPEFPSCMRVLLVEDNADSAESLGILLRSHGLSVDLAHTGADALQLAGTVAPSVVLLDIGLPDMSGYEVARQLRRTLQNRTVPIIAVSGWAQEQDRARGRDAGIDLHLAKPIDPDRLFEAIITLEEAKSIAPT